MAGVRREAATSARVAKVDENISLRGVVVNEGEWSEPVQIQSGE